jgi:hypothetical protein
MQVLPQKLYPMSQLQVPLVHIENPPVAVSQLFPHAPQLLGSVLVLVQVLPHSVCPELHDV